MCLVYSLSLFNINCCYLSTFGSRPTELEVQVRFSLQDNREYILDNPNMSNDIRDCSECVTLRGELDCGYCSESYGMPLPGTSATPPTTPVAVVITMDGLTVSDVGTNVSIVPNPTFEPIGDVRQTINNYEDVTIKVHIAIQ